MNYCLKIRSINIGEEKRIYFFPLYVSYFMLLKVYCDTFLLMQCVITFSYNELPNQSMKFKNILFLPGAYNLVTYIIIICYFREFKFIIIIKLLCSRMQITKLYKYTYLNDPIWIYQYGLGFSLPLNTKIAIRLHTCSS